MPTLARRPSRASAKDGVESPSSTVQWKQLNGQYKVKNEGIKPLFAQVQTLRLAVQATFSHVPREKNARADALANLAMDEGLSCK